MKKWYQWQSQKPARLSMRLERLVLRYSDVLTSENRVEDTLYTVLEKRFPKAELLGLCFIVGLSNPMNWVHATFRTDS